MNLPDPSTPVVVFHTSSHIEASVVMALLDSHGIESFRISGNPQAIWPMTVNALGQIQIAVASPEADEARRIIGSHRQEVGARLVRLEDAFTELERRVGYRFKDRGLLEQALTHRSRAAEDVSGAADNESLEFLGDAVLGFVVADRLFHQFPEYNEGQKSKIKAAVVSTQSLARHAEAISLGDYLLLGRGEEKTGGRLKSALLADTYEALLAAIYLDGGIEHARAFIVREFGGLIDDVRRGGVSKQDYKSTLQELLQSRELPLPEYRLVGTLGPDHRKRFEIEVVVRGERLASATGPSKKEAEQEAARMALRELSHSDA